jgi:hypothetical protein
VVCNSKSSSENSSAGIKAMIMGVVKVVQDPAVVVVATVGVIDGIQNHLSGEKAHQVRTVPITLKAIGQNQMETVLKTITSKNLAK